MTNDRLAAAVSKLRSRGLIVEAAEIPGLWYVSGYPELTTAQLLYIAEKL